MKHHYFYKDVISIEGSGTVVDLLCEVGAIETEAKALIYGNDDFTLEIYEGATATTGTPITGYACNREDDRAHMLTLSSAPSVSNAGTLIWKSRTAAGKNNTGVTQGINYIFEVKKNTKYIWRITKNAAGTHWVDVDFFWSEINPNAI